MEVWRTPLILNFGVRRRFQDVIYAVRRLNGSPGTNSLNCRVMSPKDADGICKQCKSRSSLIWVCTVCPDMCVQKLMIITVLPDFSLNCACSRCGMGEFFILIHCLPLFSLSLRRRHNMSKIWLIGSLNKISFFFCTYFSKNNSEVIKISWQKVAEETYPIFWQSEPSYEERGLNIVWFVILQMSQCSNLVGPVQPSSRASAAI